MKTSAKRTVRFSGMLITGLALLSLGMAAHADELLNTGKPDGPFGYIGYDVFEGQSVAVAFTPMHNYFLDNVGVWIMSNDANPGAKFTLSLRPDAGDGEPRYPSDTIIESWEIATQAAGWDPVFERRRSRTRPVLRAGHTYWLVAESSEAAGENAVWVWGDGTDPTYVSILNDASGTEWQTGLVTGSAPGAIVNATKRGP